MAIVFLFLVALEQLDSKCPIPCKTMDYKGEMVGMTGTYWVVNSTQWILKFTIIFWSLTWLPSLGQLEDLWVYSLPFHWLDLLKRYLIFSWGIKLFCLIDNKYHNSTICKTYFSNSGFFLLKIIDINKCDQIFYQVKHIKIHVSIPKWFFWLL